MAEFLFEKAQRQDGALDCKPALLRSVNQPHAGFVILENRFGS